MRPQFRFVRSEARAGARQLALYLLCVMCAVVAVASVGGWRKTVDSALAVDAKETAGGDVVVFSTVKFSPALERALAPYHGISTVELFTVAQGISKGAPAAPLFSKLKAVEPGYPLYGEVPLASGGKLQEALKKGVVVEQKVLERLGLQVGDELEIGKRTLPIADVALREPDRPLGLIGISPRIFVAYRDLESLGLVRKGSYSERRVHILLPDPSRAQEVADELREAAVPDQERVETWQRPPVNIRRFVDNFFTFLDMMAVFAVALGGLGMQGTLSAWLRERRTTIAIARTLGASPRFVFWHYALIAASVTVMGILLGLVGAALLLHLSGTWLATLLPVKVTPYLTLAAALQSSLLGLIVSAGFTTLPFLNLSQVRPASVLRQEETPLKSSTSRGLGLALLGTTFGLLWALLHNLVRALEFSAGLAAILILVSLLTALALKMARRWRPRSLALRVGLRGLQAPATSTRAIVTILAAALAVLFCVALVEQALDSSWVEALPENAPNLVFFDIQPDQAQAFSHTLGQPVQLYPSIRVRIKDVDGQPLPRKEKRDYFESDARREFSSSARTSMDPDEALASGASLFAPGDDIAQVSASDSVAKLAHLSVGSNVTFSIQGVPLEAKVSSIRHTVHTHFRPSFDFVFPPALVAGAPQTIYAAARVADDEVGPLQTRIAKAFPSITSMDVSLTIRLVASKLTQLIGLIRFFLGGGGLAGLVILVSASLSNRLTRMRESAYYKILGATRGFVSRVLLWENALLGLLCSSIGLILAAAVTWGICHWELEVDFPMVPGTWLAMLTVPTLIVTLLGWAVSRSVIQARPAPFLREDA